MRKSRTAKKPGGKALYVVHGYYPNVTRVIDADKPIIIQVTEKDVARSNVRDHRTCAMAVACKRTLNSTGVLIMLGTSYIIMGNTAIRYKNTGTVSREIVSFDRKAGFRVGYYMLTPFPPAARLGVRKITSGPSGKSNGKIKRFRHYTTDVRTALRGVAEIA